MFSTAFARQVTTAVSEHQIQGRRSRLARLRAHRT